MANIDVKFNPSIFRKDWPMVMATGRAGAKLLPVRVRYNSDGYPAGQVVARNSTDGLYQKYNDAGASGINTAVAVLFEGLEADADFDSTASSGSAMATGIFGGCMLYYDKLTGLDANALVDLGARQVIDASGIRLLDF